MTACSPPSTPAARPKSRRVRALIVATGCSKKKQQPAAVVAAAAFTLARIVGSDDLMFKILGCLTETHDLGACSCVSRRWHTLADADELWRARCTKADPLAVALKQHPCLRQPSYKQIMAQKAKAEAVQDEAEDEDEPPAPCRSEYMIGVEVSTMVEQPSSTTDKKDEEEVFLLDIWAASGGRPVSLRCGRAVVGNGLLRERRSPTSTRTCSPTPSAPIYATCTSPSTVERHYPDNLAILRPGRVVPRCRKCTQRHPLYMF